MTSYAKKELARYWPVSSELMEQYRDGTHTVKNSAGSLIWRKQNDQRHRDGDKPEFIGANGHLEWCQNNQLHRDGDKPAIIGASGALYWYQNGQAHRFRGPAVIRPDGRLEWWINHKNITQEVNAWLDREEWQETPLQIFEFQLRFV